MHSPSIACGTHTMADKMIDRDVALVLRDRDQRLSETTSVTHVSQSTSMSQAMSSSMTAKQNFGWRTTTLRVGQAGWTTTSSSSNSSPIYLADSVRALLDHLPRNVIDGWEDLGEIFTGNFQGMYIWPSNPLNLKSCRQKLGESLRGYIWRFSRKCHEILREPDADVISAFCSAQLAEPWCMNSAGTSRTPPRSYLILLPSTPLVRRRSEPSLLWAMEKWSLVTTGQHCPKAPTKARRKMLRAARRGKSNAPDGSLSQPVETMMTRKQTAPTKSMLQPPSAISSARRGSQKTILRNFSKRPV
jgi:hypothetical protein